MDIFPISKTVADWNTLLNIEYRVTGKKYNHNQPQGKEENNLYVDILKDIFETNMLQYVSYGFIIIANKEFFFWLMQWQNIISLNINLSIKLDYFVGIMTGTLQQYVDLIERCSSGEEYVEIRLLANYLQNYFESEGFRHIFYKFVKLPMVGPDTSYRLTAR